jgi:hypothetical protein
MNSKRMSCIGAAIAAAVIGGATWLGALGQEKAAQEKTGQPKSAGDAALERTRKQVRILDDVYKTAIVLITENYVDEASDLAAGAAFQKLFEAMRQKGHHDVRLLDATGDPYDKDNSPRDDFEKAAIQALKQGQPYFEQIVENNGQRLLKAATPIPVVLKKCTLCHAAYEKAKPGEPIGALGYTLKIE